MYARTNTAAINGITAYHVEIESHIENGLPSFQIVGLPDGAIRESRERVMAALKNSRYPIQPKRIVVNLAPADVRKEGSAFDLAIAIGMLAAFDVIDVELVGNCVLLGELAFDGSVRPIHGALSIAMMVSKQRKYGRVLLPSANADEAAVVDGVDIIPIDSLQDTVNILTGIEARNPHKVDIASIIREAQTKHAVDLADVKGQEGVKRAMEIAAAGGHNLIMIGPPGAGKTMLAKRLPTILPPLTVAEALETTKIHSVAGLLPPGQALVTRRPFRAPHHTISDAALVGGGVGVVRAGEISLAHHGVLFLDELPEFQRNVLEVLRQPLEDKRITVARSKMTVDYPANVMLVCSMNPCPCGHFGDLSHECTCKPLDVQKYMGRVSGPLLDRIDIHVDVPSVGIDALANAPPGTPSSVVRERVLTARERQKHRFSGQTGLYKNADMTTKDIERMCKLDDAGAAVLKAAMVKLGLSARAYDRILKVARTIADLAESENIRREHVAEAVQYRTLDRPYWNG
ncbi:MAG TPA: magnesium chelatase [Bacteroidetes bacterium]|nr:magnesium chelatase [Bacteroidota bacterium]HRK04841.1 YifB family Mg chelatase-like AAA ATPase [Chlorobiota bacterium]